MNILPNFIILVRKVRQIGYLTIPVLLFLNESNKKEVFSVQI